MKINFNSRHTTVYVKQRGPPLNVCFCWSLVHHFSMMIYKTRAKKVIPFSRIAAGRPTSQMTGVPILLSGTGKMRVNDENASR
jgi:hypothetical protein